MCEDGLMLDAQFNARLSVLELEYREELENSLNSLNIDATEKNFSMISKQSGVKRSVNLCIISRLLHT
jgi:hypothetical protein